MRVLAFLIFILACLPAHASSLRRVTTLHGPLEFLKDLFDDSPDLTHPLFNGITHLDIWDL